MNQFPYEQFSMNQFSHFPLNHPVMGGSYMPQPQFDMAAPYMGGMNHFAGHLP